MNNQTNIKSWDAMTNDERLDRLTSVLTRAGSDVKFRDRCLSSTESAKQAVSEAGEIEFAPDFEIQFLTPEQRLKKLVLAVPEFIPPQNGKAELRNAEDYQACTYFFWRS
ncbi:MAG TPA: hypothetical protein VGW57_14640 [Chthoniobacterales bacterium]|nr:hypothetical protein [Chthoniobacterales bacterium]